jgi:dihydroorotate dehydrogenase
MDLTTRYMGLTLKHPLVASASPLSERVDVIRQLEDSGASAVVLFLLFEEQVRHHMTTWLEQKGYSSISQLRGCMSQRSVRDSAAFMRSNYIKVLGSYGA